jgi:hypothetical protein
LGNTENVVNSQNQTEELDDAEKTNQYVSWYLNGVTSRAEYGEDIDPNKIINFSGPIKKLLPQSIQHKYQIETVNAREEDRHDQVVVCANESFLGIVGAVNPEPCYQGDEYRLSDWDGDLSFFNASLNRLINLLTFALPSVAEDYIRDSLANAWNDRTPPLPWDEQFEGNDTLYRKAYNEWRGKSCVIVPLINFLFCIENPFVLNKYADLFPYVPLSSTEDRVGEVSVDSQNVTPASENLEISNVSMVTTPAELFFAHTEEVAGLAEKLQLTFVPQGNPLTGRANYTSPMESCDLTNVRSNEGDDLFAESISGTLSYDAEFSCEYSDNSTTNSCTKDVSVGLGVETETPKADEVWSRLVAGPSGIFKRIFPKIGLGGAILGILDMPGAPNVTYSGSGLVSAGNPGARAGENAELYFPHVGGVSEYFLKGIQSILRPKGYGEPILSGALGTFASSGEIDCDQNAADIDLPRTIGREAYFQLALDWLAGQTGNHALECYNDTVRRAIDAGVNPAFALWMWVHESDASNYAQGYNLDFGVAFPPRVGYTAQITEFLGIARAIDASDPRCAGRNVSDMQAFAYIYLTGTCDPNQGDSRGTSGAEYYQMIRDQWGYLTSCPFLSSPEDTSCR